MTEKQNKRLKKTFFVTSSTSVNVFFKDQGLQKGERFKIYLTLKSHKLDKDGFVIDFIKLKNMLQSTKEKIHHKHIENLINSEFSYRLFLDFLNQEFKKQLANDDIVINKIILESEHENVGVEY